MNRSQIFKQSLLSTIGTLYQCEESSVSEQAVKLTTFLHRHAEDVFGKKFPTVSNPGSKTFINKPKWFDNNCFNAKINFKGARNDFKRTKSNANRNNYIQMRNV